MKVLFVCSANVDRSKTAEDFFAEQFTNIAFESAGTNHSICQQKGTNPLDQDFLDNADLTLVMEQKHLNWMKENLNTKGKKIEILGIEDRYRYYSMELIELLQRRCHSYFYE
ncbi:MAG: phosphotyrosine protein phosphatase [Crocinitomicaceae bacterium]|nr:phosphotyrosine protein phosphatase [Crocinitomicaceae bacterium]